MPGHPWIVWGEMFKPNKIVKKGDDYLDSIKVKFNSLLDSMTGKYNGGKADISDINDSRRKEAKRPILWP